MFPLHDYLDRIGLSDVPDGVEGLRVLQESHMRALTFENVDPLLGRVPRLDLEGLAAKFLTPGRGGYCFEHNALFGMALEALGYAPRTLLCRVRNGASEGGARTHQAFDVSVDGTRWLADTGFGGHGSLHPVSLGLNTPQEAPNGQYRVVHDAHADETVLERRSGEAWVSLYGFDAVPVRAIDLETANFVCARWDGAPFVNNLMLARHTENGRRAMFNRALTIGLPPDTETREIETAANLGEVLRTEFRLDLPDADVGAIWAKIKDAPTRR